MKGAAFPDQAARDAAERDPGGTFFVEAAAGTGKTTALVRRILTALQQRRARLTEIVAITFTEKAAGELKMRLREAIEEKLAGDARAAALADLERAAISTIHSFCAGLLRERPVEAAVDPQFAVADEIQTQLLLEEAWEQWLAAELAKNVSALRHALIFEVGLSQLRELATILVEQRTRLESVRWRWPASLPLNADRLLATLRAAAPALERAMAHCVARALPTYQRARILLDVLPLLEHASAERQLAALSALGLTKANAKADFDSESAFREFNDAVHVLKPTLEESAATADHNLLVELLRWLCGFVEHFQQHKHKRAVLDFDDLLLKTRKLLRDHADVRKEFRRRSKLFLVDEFQDTDPAQTEIVLALGAGQQGKLFIVGDPKQSIYSFRRADIEIYTQARRQLEREGRTLMFSQNFRSRSTIVDWVNDVFAKMIQRPDDGDYQPDYIALAPSPQLHASEPRVTLLRPKQWPDKPKAGETRRAEADAVARYLHQQVAAGAYRWGDVAMLFRSFTGVETYGGVLQQHGIPYRVIGGRGYYQRQEILTLNALLSCLDNPADKLSLVAVLRSPLFGWTDELIFLVSETHGLDYLCDGKLDSEQAEQTFARLRELHALRHDLSVAAFVERALARTKICEAFLASQRDGAQCVANLLKALELARQCEGAGLRSMRGFVRRLRQTVLSGVEEESSPAVEEADNIVRILTMHKAKGLEFPVVVLADLASTSRDNNAKLVLHRAAGAFELRFAGRRTRGFDTANQEQNKRDEAEEIRLLYVAATRAKERLILPWFQEKGERLDLLRRGFEPVASRLVEAPDLDSLSVGVSERPRLRGERVEPLLAKRRAWQAERKALLDCAAKAPPRRTPSALGHEAEPFVEAEPAASAGGREIGSVVHEALERVDWRARAAEQRKQVHQVITQSALDEAQRRHARELAVRMLDSDLAARLRVAERVERELPFSMIDPENPDGLLEGKMDLLFCEKGHWVLVDYKTDREVDAERYRAQFRAYEQALERLAKIKPTEKFLFFLAANRQVNL